MRNIKNRIKNIFYKRENIFIAEDNKDFIFNYRNSKTLKEYFDLKLHGSLDECYIGAIGDLKIVIGFTTKRRYEQPYSELLIFYKDVIILKNNFDEENNNYVDIKNKLIKIIKEHISIINSDTKILEEFKSLNEKLIHGIQDDYKYFNIELGFSQIDTLANNKLSIYDPVGKEIEVEFFFMDNELYIRDVTGYTNSYLFFNYNKSNTRETIIAVSKLPKINSILEYGEDFFDKDAFITSCKYVTVDKESDDNYDVVYESVIFNDKFKLNIYLLTDYNFENGVIIVLKDKALESFNKKTIQNMHCYSRAFIEDSMGLHRFNGGRKTENDIDLFVNNFIKNEVIRYFASDKIYELVNANKNESLNDENLEMLKVVLY